MRLSMTIKISPQEWTAAEQFFRDPKNKAKKFNKKNVAKFLKVDTKHAHSFILLTIDGKESIYALNNTKHGQGELDAGAGSFGRSKVAINQAAHRIIIKVTAEKEANEPEVEKILKDTGYLLAQKEIDLGKRGKIKVAGKNILTEKKFYTAYAYRGDRNLHTAIHKNDELEDNNGKKLIIALKAMMEIDKLHQKGIIHKDIKPDSFVLEGDGAELKVSPVDFGLSQKMLKGQTFVESEKPGAIAYLAPESKFPVPEEAEEAEEVYDLFDMAAGKKQPQAREANQNSPRFSPQSDIYALGVMFNTNLRLPQDCNKMISKMKKDNPLERAALIACMEDITKVMSKREYQTDGSPEALAEFEAYKKQIQPEQEQKQKEEPDLRKMLIDLILVYQKENYSMLPGINWMRKSHTDNRQAQLKYLLEEEKRAKIAYDENTQKRMPEKEAKAAYAKEISETIDALKTERKEEYNPFPSRLDKMLVKIEALIQPWIPKEKEEEKKEEKEQKKPAPFHK